MAWLHCSIKDGSCVAITDDANFDPDDISEAMERDFVHVHVDEPLEDVQHLITTIHDGEFTVEDSGRVNVPNLVHKHRGKIDLSNPGIIPADIQGDVKNPNRRVKPLKKIIPLARITDQGK